MNMKTKTTMMVMAAALLCGIGNVCALPLRVLIEEQHAKIEPAIKKFQQECSGHTDSQACKEEHDALVKALNEFLSLVQNGFKVIDAHANDASDADYQKQIAALRAKAQQHLDWGREQLAALQSGRDSITSAVRGKRAGIVDGIRNGSLPFGNQKRFWRDPGG